MVYLLSDRNRGCVWGIGNVPILKTEKITELYAEGEELRKIRKQFPELVFGGEDCEFQIWFGGAAQKIAQGIGASK